MANIDNPNGFKFEQSLVGHAELVKGVQAISNVIAKGDAVIESGATAGQIAVAASTSGLLMGVAAGAVTTGAGATGEIWFYPAVPWLIFSGQTSGSFALTSVYAVCDIEGTTGIMEVNEDASTESVLYILGMRDDSVVGTWARVYFMILRSSYYPAVAAL